MLGTPGLTASPGPAVLVVLADLPKMDPSHMMIARWGGDVMMMGNTNQMGRNSFVCFFGDFFLRIRGTHGMKITIFQQRFFYFFQPP